PPVISTAPARAGLHGRSSCSAGSWSGAGFLDTARALPFSGDLFPCRYLLGSCSVHKRRYSDQAVTTRPHVSLSFFLRVRNIGRLVRGNNKHVFGSFNRSSGNHPILKAPWPFC